MWTPSLSPSNWCSILWWNHPRRPSTFCLLSSFSIQCTSHSLCSFSVFGRDTARAPYTPPNHACLWSRVRFGLGIHLCPCTACGYLSLNTRPRPACACCAYRITVSHREQRSREDACGSRGWHLRGQREVVREASSHEELRRPGHPQVFASAKEWRHLDDFDHVLRFDPMHACSS